MWALSSSHMPWKIWLQEQHQQPKELGGGVCWITNCFMFVQLLWFVLSWLQCSTFQAFTFSNLNQKKKLEVNAHPLLASPPKACAITPRLRSSFWEVVVCKTCCPWCVLCKLQARWVAWPNLWRRLTLLDCLVVLPWVVALLACLLLPTQVLDWVAGLVACLLLPTLPTQVLDWVVGLVACLLLPTQA